MPIDTYNVTYQTVLDDIGGADVSQISATSRHINHAKVTAWVERGAGKVNAIVEAEQLTVSTDAQIQSASIAVIEFAKARVYERLNRHEAKRDAMQAYNDELDTLRRLSDEFGDTADTSRVLSNVDTVDPERRKFVTYNDTRKDGFRGW